MTASSTRDPVRADIGVIGGSGLYAFLDEADEISVPTPYGEPSDPIVVGTIGGRRVAFLPRHGRDHRFPPHRIPFRANLWALRAVGVRQVLAPCAVGSLRAEIGPGSLVVPDQLVDRTSGRVQTYYDSRAVHVPFADPYCPVGRQTVVTCAEAAGLEPVDGGTMVVIEGPRFSTRSESRSYSAAGWTVVNMTGHPEAVLARELALCYTALALVTDHDAGVEGGPAVTQDEVFRVFAHNTSRLRDLLYTVVEALPSGRDCPCARALDGMTTGVELP
ncbi:MAG: S-methyl-5'-thioadenosine phosphorylase [Actinomycetota bacterium]|nr:S-methyl-5'-thioadenosine phosphorylase [Actinomycetota bacterium]